MKAYIYCDLTNRQSAVLVDEHGKVIQSDPSAEFDGDVLGFLHSEGPEAANDWIAWHPELCADLVQAYNVPADIAIGPAKYAEYYDAPVVELPDNATSVEDALQEITEFGQLQGEGPNPLAEEYPFGKPDPVGEQSSPVFEFEQDEDGEEVLGDESDDGSDAESPEEE